MGPVIETAKAIIRNDVQIMKFGSQFTLPRTILDPNQTTVDHKTFIKMTYRRFIRLKPLVSRRAMVRDTYLGYIRCKYRYEPLGLKKKLICPKHTLEDSGFELRQQIYNSLQFILQSVTFDENIPSKLIREDIKLSRQIVKNLLTVEYEKLKDDAQNKWNYKKGIMQNTNIIDYNVECNHLKPNDKLKRDKEVKYAAIKSFDECLVYLNKTLKTLL